MKNKNFSLLGNILIPVFDARNKQYEAKKQIENKIDPAKLKQDEKMFICQI